MTSIQDEIDIAFKQANERKNFITDSLKEIESVIAPYNIYFKENDIKLRFVCAQFPVPYQHPDARQYAVHLKDHSFFSRAFSLLSRKDTFPAYRPEILSAIHLNIDPSKKTVSYFLHPHRFENHGNVPIDGTVSEYVRRFVAGAISASVNENVLPESRYEAVNTLTCPESKSFLEPPKI